MSEYEQGYRDGAADAANLKRIEHRVEAFGAIRRAAGWARYADAEAGSPFPVNPPQTQQEERLRLLPAQAIRKAIRVAIGSEKA